MRNGDKDRPTVSTQQRQIVKSGPGYLANIGWFSLINTAIALLNGNVIFVIGLGITELVDIVAQQFGSIAKVIGVVVNLGIAGMFIGLAKLAERGDQEVYVLGMILYSLDTMLILGFALLLKSETSLWLGVAFHSYFLFRLGQAYRVAGKSSG